MNRSTAIFLLLLAASAVLFSANVGGYDLWPADEPRYGQVGREMLRSGDYLAPHVNGEPYFEKPPLLFWLIAAVSAPVGDVTEFSARMPSVIAALVVLCFTFLLARRLYGDRVAIWSAVILALSVRFWWQARTVQIDMLLTACMTGALLAFWLWHTSRRTQYLILLYAAVALGLLAKGPPALVFPLLLIIVFYWRQPADRKQTHWIIGMLAAIAVVALWMIPARMSVADETAATEAAQAQIGNELQRQILERLFTIGNHAQWPWYYAVKTLPVDWLPWTLFAPYMIYYVWKRRRDGEETRLLLAWTLPALIFFSISIGKRSVYILPLFPAIAILFSVSILDLMDNAREVWRKRTAWAWVVFLLLLAIAPVALLFTEYADAWNVGMAMFAVVAGVFTAVSIVTARQNGRNLHLRIAAQMFVLFVLVPFVAFPALNPYKSAREITAPIRTLTHAGEDFRLFSIAFSREEYVYYSDKFHEPLLTDLIAIELPPGSQEVNVMMLQLDLRSTVSRAARDVPIADLEYVTSAEHDALANAMRAAEADADIAPALAEAFHAGLRQAMAPLETSKPAFAFIQAKDYRWLLPLVPPLGNYRALHRDGVGSRDVMLLANAEGLRLLEQYRLAGTLPPAKT
ncbi:MAG: glycosyltransferase family 39 protein [Candidatus Hydrogenedentales bacterium]